MIGRAAVLLCVSAWRGVGTVIGRAAVLLCVSAWRGVGTVIGRACHWWVPLRQGRDDATSQRDTQE